jgi:hypothetical protein
MKKPSLILDSAPDDTFITGHCSSCDNCTFRVEGNSPAHKTLVRGIFDLHFKIHHLRDDANQAAPGS